VICLFGTRRDITAFTTKREVVLGESPEEVSMARRMLSMVAAAATVALAACSDRQAESTLEPQVASASTDPCGFSNSLVTGYFPSSRHASIHSLKQSMANAGQGTTGARTFGFQIMDSIGSVSRSFSVSSTAGAQLTMALIPCMFANASTFTYPHQNDPAFDFAEALTNVTGGAYYVRGGGTAGGDAAGRSATVLGRIDPQGGVDGNLSGIAPSAGSWTTMLSGNTASEGRALIYGYRVSTTPLSYEWATVPSGLTFSPPAVVSVCDNDLSATAMVHAEAVGVLAYVNSNICNTSQSLTTIHRGWGPRALAARLGRMFVGALVPAPLEATALLTGTGGTTAKLPKSIVSKLSVSTVVLSWVNRPPAVIKGTDPSTKFPVSFTASASGNAIFGACAYLLGANNNGTPTKLTGPQDDVNCTNPPNGDTDALSVLVTEHSLTASLADFGQVGVTKNGGINFIGIVDVLNRDGFGSINFKANVKPLK
jgi:hypothetical protein